MFFSNHKKEEDWLHKLEETKNRWFVFLDKLETKLQELSEAALPELIETSKTDEDIYKRNFQRLLSGVNGQFENILKKARDIYDNEINSIYDTLKAEVSNTSPLYDKLMQFRTDCADRYHKQFDETFQYWKNKINQTGKEDLEQTYQRLLQEFDALKNKFVCKQCGAPILINKLFFVTTYLTCSQCQTQNTFEPSTQAKNLEQLGRSLAEQRTADLLQAYEDEKNKERELYHQRHEIYLSTIHEKNKQQLEIKKFQMEALEKQRQQTIENAPILYEKYLRALFDEWNKIVPDLADQNEKFYQRLLLDFRKQYQ